MKRVPLARLPLREDPLAPADAQDSQVSCRPGYSDGSPMGLIIHVGSPWSVYTSDYARRVAHVLQSRFGCKPRRFLCPGYASREIGWSWIGDLKDFACSRIGGDGCPHLMYCNAWETVYLPAEFAPLEIDHPMLKHGTLPGVAAVGPIELVEPFQAGVKELTSSPRGLRCASLFSLQRELCQVAESAGLPVTGVALRVARKSFWKDWIHGGRSDPVTAAYLELPTAVVVARRRRLPLWVVK